MAYKFQLGSGSLGGSMRVGPIEGTGSVTSEGLISGSGKLNIQGNAAVGGALNVTGAGDFDGALSCDTSFTLDAVTVNATELGFIDGITAGTALASKAVVLDASKDITGIAAISGTLIDGTTLAGTSLNLQFGGGTDMGALSGVTTLSCSAGAQVVGNSIFGGTLSVTGAATFAAAVTAGTSFIIGTADLNEADMEKLDGITNGTVAASKAVVVSADKDISAFRRLTAVAVTASSTLTVQGSQTTASANVSGSLGLPLISDGGGLGAAGEIVAVSLSNYASAIAGTGITATNGVLSVDTSGGDSVSVTLLAVSGTAVAGMNYMGTISSSVEVALPASPTVGDVFYINQLIDGEAAVVIESPFGAVGLVYAVSDVWRII